MLKLKFQYFGHLMQRTTAATVNLLHSCLTLCDPIDVNQPDSSVPGILQAGILEQVGSLEKTLMLGEIEDRRRNGQQRMRLLDGITDSRTWVSASSRSWWWKGKPGMLQSMGLQKVRHDWVTELNWLDAHPGWFANTSSQDATEVVYSFKSLPHQLLSFLILLVLLLGNP